MARVRSRCSSCGRILKTGATRCGCGEPTELMSFADRSAFEVERWRTYQLQPLYRPGEQRYGGSLGRRS